MSLLKALFSSKPEEPPFDPKPEIVSKMPARPYRVLHAGLKFYSDPECKSEVKDATLAVLRADDPMQTHHPIECMPTRKIYAKDQILQWDINHKVQWDHSWYVNPDTGHSEKAWTRAVEFVGKLYQP
jgi:hypothetical protein